MGYSCGCASWLAPHQNANDIIRYALLILRFTPNLFQLNNQNFVFIDTMPYQSVNFLVIFIEYNNPDYTLVNIGDIGVSSGFTGHSICAPSSWAPCHTSGMRCIQAVIDNNRKGYQ